MDKKAFDQESDLEDTLTPEEEKMVAEGFEAFKRGEFITLEELKKELGL